MCVNNIKEAGGQTEIKSDHLQVTERLASLSNHGGPTPLNPPVPYSSLLYSRGFRGCPKLGTEKRQSLGCLRSLQFFLESPVDTLSMK